MNERLNELARQSGIAFLSSVPPDMLEKFAELIIQDCVDCVDGYTKFRTPGTHYDAVEQIKANFGIKE